MRRSFSRLNAWKTSGYTKQMMHLRWLLIGFLVLAGCASAPLSEEFEKIQIGMEKDRVLHIMGTPKTYRRVKSRDYYTYVFYENDVRIEREVQLEAGKVIYAGEISKPTESAEQADERIRLENERIDAEIKKEREERKKLPQKLQQDLEKPAKPVQYKEI